MKFRLLDRITARPLDGRIAGCKAVSFEEYQLREAFGGEPGLPESLVLQGFLALASWLAILESDFRFQALPVEIGQVRFTRPIGPGERLDWQVERLREIDPTTWECRGTAQVAGIPVVTVVGAWVRLEPLAGFHDPADLRVLLSEIGPPVE